MFGHDNNQDQREDEVLQGVDDSANDHKDDTPAPASHRDNAGLGGFVPTPAPSFASPSASPATPDPAAPAATDDLLDIKQEALQALTPLVGQLDQTPEEQFRTTMMMIQASDNHSLVKVAYDAAQKIGNEKERAQALLDIVNEINYFTQQNQQ